MNSTCNLWQSRFARARRWLRRGALWALAGVVVFSGCSPKSDVPVGDAAENIRMLALGFVQFAAANQGKGPPDEVALVKYMAQRSGMTEEEAKSRLVSPRDNQPYVIRWGMAPMQSSITGADAPNPNIIIYENIGADGTRIVANGRMSVREVPNGEFSQLVPDHNSTGT